MSERERLAADLHDIACGASSRAEWDLCVRDHRHEADRFIALGWTRLDSGVAQVMGRAADALDDYRAYPNVHIESSLIVHLRKLAKAYREDTE